MRDNSDAAFSINWSLALEFRYVFLYIPQSLDMSFVYSNQNNLNVGLQDNFL